MADSHNDMNTGNSSPDANYWRSFEELYNTPQALEKKHHEFAQGVTDDFDPGKDLSGVSRRKFLALLGASAALAGAGCSDYIDRGAIIPYNKRPEEITLGKPNFYASTCTACEQGCGVLIRTREGRPIKVDGNPDHPVNKGKICVKGHGNILDLYDPSRLKEPLYVKNGIQRPLTWKEADNNVIAVLKQAGSKQIAIVTRPVSSPAAAAMLAQFVAKYPTAKVYSLSQFGELNRSNAWAKSTGVASLPVYNWEKAKVILSLEGDFLGKEGNVLEQNRAFANGRDVNNLKNFKRLYAAEGNMSLTGVNADYRFMVNPALQYEFVLALLAELAGKGAFGMPAEAAGRSLAKFAAANKLDKKKLESLVQDLLANRTEALVYAGNPLDEQTHIAVNLLNSLLSGNSLLLPAVRGPLTGYTSMQDFAALVSAMNAGSVAAVIHVDTNPVFNLPADLGYKAALANVKTVVTITESSNESSALSNYILPAHHNFEAWGDANVRTGVYSLQQPVIAPLYGTRQKEGILLNWLSDDPGSYSETTWLNYLKGYWQQSVFPRTGSVASFDRFWQASLHDGIVVTNESVAAPAAVNPQALAGLSAPIKPQGMVLLVTESYALADGRMANNGWLQELPHPVSKVTWDNYAAIAYETAKQLGVKTNDSISVKTAAGSLVLPVVVQPGVAPGVIAVEGGYGRDNSPAVANGVGVNINVLLSKNGGVSPWVYSGVSVSKTGATYEVISVQDHHSFDDTFVADLHKTRGIIREGTVAEYKKNPKFIAQEHEGGHLSMYEPHEYPEVKWGMSIDLNKCTGCAQCVVACNVENNIPVVGKDQVANSREMMWLRIDRYYSGTPEDPKVSLQPMLCQHCDKAPCENVCPVAATQHSPDGLNQMAYNRCVGTRYCSNNCPYKVRRFNFFNFRDHFANGYQQQDSLQLIHNPEVTVRSRGVMEKCTFCIQRIAEARADATAAGKKLKGSDVQTACQVACPTEAIKFGDSNDKDSEFYKYRNHELGYYVLDELNIKPNVTYIAKLRNTHPEEA